MKTRTPGRPNLSWKGIILYPRRRVYFNDPIDHIVFRGLRSGRGSYMFDHRPHQGEAFLVGNLVHNNDPRMNCRRSRELAKVSSVMGNDNQIERQATLKHGVIGSTEIASVTWMFSVVSLMR